MPVVTTEGVEQVEGNTNHFEAGEALSLSLHLGLSR